MAGLTNSASGYFVGVIATSSLPVFFFFFFLIMLWNSGGDRSFQIFYPLGHISSRKVISVDWVNGFVLILFKMEKKNSHWRRHVTCLIKPNWVFQFSQFNVNIVFQQKTNSHKKNLCNKDVWSPVSFSIDWQCLLGSCCMWRQFPHCYRFCVLWKRIHSQFVLTLAVHQTCKFFFWYTWN